MSLEIVVTTFLYKDTNGIPHGGSVQNKPFVPFLSGNSIVKAEKQHLVVIVGYFYRNFFCTNRVNRLFRSHADVHSVRCRSERKRFGWGYLSEIKGGVVQYSSSEHFLIRHGVVYQTNRYRIAVVELTCG